MMARLTIAIQEEEFVRMGCSWARRPLNKVGLKPTSDKGERGFADEDSSQYEIAATWIADRVSACQGLLASSSASRASPSRPSPTGGQFATTYPVQISTFIVHSCVGTAGSREGSRRKQSVVRERPSRKSG